MNPAIEGCGKSILDYDNDMLRLKENQRMVKSHSLNTSVILLLTSLFNFTAASNGLDCVWLKVSDEKFYILPELVENFYFRCPEPNRCYFYISFKKEASKEIGSYISNNVGNELSLIMNGKPLTQPAKILEGGSPSNFRFSIIDRDKASLLSNYLKNKNRPTR